MGLINSLKRLDDRVVRSHDGRWTARRPPHLLSLGISGSIIFGGGLLLRVLLPDQLPTPPLFTMLYLVVTLVCFGHVLAGLAGKTRLAVGAALVVALVSLSVFDATRPCDGGLLKEAFLVLSNGGSYEVRCAV